MAVLSMANLRAVSEGMSEKEYDAMMECTMVLDEAYYGRKQVEPVRDAMDKLRTFVLNNPKAVYAGIPEVKALEQAVKKSFGFKRVSIYMGQKYRTGNLIDCQYVKKHNPIGATKAPWKEKHSDGFFDDDHSMVAIISFSAAIFSLCKCTTDEAVALLLHEVARMFDFSIFRYVDDWISVFRDAYTAFTKTYAAIKGASDKIIKVVSTKVAPRMKAASRPEQKNGVDLQFAEDMLADLDSLFAEAFGDDYVEVPVGGQNNSNSQNSFSAAAYMGDFATVLKDVVEEMCKTPELAAVAARSYGVSAVITAVLKNLLTTTNDFGRTVEAFFNNLGYSVMKCIPPINVIVRPLSKFGWNVSRFIKAFKNVITAPMDLIHRIKKAPGYFALTITARKTATYADTFVASYGYGPELSSAIDKISAGTEVSEINLGPITGVVNNYNLCVSEIFKMFTSEDGANMPRTRAMIDKLKRDLNDPEIKKEDADELREEISRLEDAYETVVKHPENHRLALAGVFRRLLDKWYNSKPYNLYEDLTDTVRTAAYAT